MTFITGRDYRVDKAIDDVDIMLHSSACPNYTMYRSTKHWLSEQFKTVEEAEKYFHGYRVRTHPTKKCLKGQGTHLPPKKDRRY